MKIPMNLSSRPNMFAAAMALVWVAACMWGFPLQAQNANQPAPAAGQFVPQKLNPEELGQLLAPIALYPDALIALILPASTVPSDIVLGARYVQANGDPNLAKNQPWDESVKSLTRQPTDRSGNPVVGTPANPAVINTLPGTTKADKKLNRSGNPVTQPPDAGNTPPATKGNQGKRTWNSPPTTVSPGSPGSVTPDTGQQKRGRSIQTPSTPPQVPGQMNSQPRSQTQEPRSPGSRPSIPKSTPPQSGNVRVPASQAHHAFEPSGDAVEVPKTGDITQANALLIFHR